jgi:predicted nuclease of predicted toxin-antitoxin system
VSAAVPGLLLDEHVNVGAYQQLLARGGDVAHVLDAGLAGAPDPEVLQWAIEEGRVVVTRNYRDFAPLVQNLAASGVPFPGVLFLATSIRQNDVSAHVRAIDAWVTAFAAGDKSVTSSFSWLF